MDFERELLEEILRTSLSRGGDYADIFIEESKVTSLHWDSGTLRDVQTGTLFGAGIRVVTGTNFLYIYSGNPSPERLREMASEASEAAGSGRSGTIMPLGDSETEEKHSIQIYPESAGLEKKLEYLRRSDEAGRAYSPLISDVIISYSDKDQQIITAASDGTYAEDRRVRTRMAVTAVAVSGDKRESGFYGPGKAMGLEFFELFPPEGIAREAARSACVLLESDHAPQGSMPVILANEFGGVIFHEACGHALESTSIAKGASPFAGKLNKRIASPQVTAYDDGTLANEWGSSHVDDEGSPTRRTKLIQRGKLVSYLVDKVGSLQTGHPVTGNGRRESYKYPPASRMTNTFIDAGTHTFDQLVSAVDNGLYCRRMGGGSVNPSTTEFNFAVAEAYLVTNGKLDRPVKGASLIGKGTEVLRLIEMAGKDLELGTGMCGSVSGSVPASVGQPTILVSSLLVGGRS